MVQPKLKDRINSYQEINDYRLLPRIPIIMVINGKLFSKLTSLLEKPFDSKFAECMFSTTLRLCTEVEGVIFAYQFNDEIVLVARNDQNNETVPWLDNKIQKICSVISSIATMHFNDCASSIKLNLSGDPFFYSQIFTVPNIVEAINTIISKQQYNSYTSIQFACFYELIKKYDKLTIKEMLGGLTIDDKINLLQEECKIDFIDYHQSFRRGIACYKVPTLINNDIKNKWTINHELPIFAKDQSFLNNIFKFGQDIFRAE